MDARCTKALAAAALLGLMACADNGGNPSGTGGTGGNGGDKERAQGRIWVVTEGTTTFKPAATVFDLEWGDKLRSVELPQDPRKLVLTSKYAWVLCKDWLLLRIRRSDLAVDSLRVERRSGMGPGQYEIAADETQVWLADILEGFVHVDAEGLREVGRMRFNDPDGQSVEGIALVEGIPWVLLGYTNFRLLKINPTERTPAGNVFLGENERDPDGPRVSGQRGTGALGVSGTRALVYDYRSRKFIRVDLAALAVEQVWKPEWVREAGIYGEDVRIHGYTEGFLVTSNQAEWVKRVGLSGTDVATLELPTFVTHSAVRPDGLLAAGYFNAVRGASVSLVRAAPLDTVPSMVNPLGPDVDIALE